MSKHGLNFVLLVALFSLAPACNETAQTSESETANLNSQSEGTGDESGISTITTTTSNELSNYTVTTFSENIYLHNSAEKILVSYDFFPTGSDVCQQATYDATSNPNGCRVAKTVVLPCAFQSVTDDMLSTSVSAATDTESCDNQTVIDADAAEFTVHGLVFSAAVVDVFETDFEFKITRDGFVDVSDDTALTFSNADVDLENVYDKILERR